MQQKGILADLFDFDFRNLITMRIIKIIYIIAIVGVGLASIGILVSGLALMRYSGGMGFLYLILAPLAFLIGTIYTRLFLELTIVLFRIESNTAALANKDAALGRS